jgi:hypothetical protein
MLSATIAVCATFVCVVPDHECSGLYYCCRVALLSRNWCQLLSHCGTAEVRCALPSMIDSGDVFTGVLLLAFWFRGSRLVAVRAVVACRVLYDVGVSCLWAQAARLCCVRVTRAHGTFLCVCMFVFLM